MHSKIPFELKERSKGLFRKMRVAVDTATLTPAPRPEDVTGYTPRSTREMHTAIAKMMTRR